METGNFEFGGELSDEAKAEKRKKAAEKLRESLHKKEQPEKKKPASKEKKKLPWLKVAEKEASPAKKNEPEADTPKPATPETKKAATLEERKRAYLKEKVAQEAIELQEKVQNSAPDSLQAAQAKAELEVVQALAQKAEDPDIEVDPAIDEEFDRRMEAITEADLVAFEHSETEEQPPLEDQATHSLPESSQEEDESNDDADPLKSPSSTAQHQSSQATTQAPSGQPLVIPTPPLSPLPAQPPNTPPTPPRSAPTPPPAPGGGGHNTPPPATPNTPNYGGGPPTVQYNVAPQTPAEDNPTKRTERSKASGSVLAGALVGYAIGRRGGRKRTEAKLQPKIEAAEREVAKTERHFAARQAELRSAIAARRQETTSRAPVETSPPPTILEKITQSSTVDRPKTQSVEQQVAQATEQARSAVPSYEASLSQLSPAESVTASAAHSAEQTIQPKQAAETTPPAKKFEEMNTPEILRAAESLHIDGVSVRRLYETNQIDRPGLIKIVRESMQGGDIKTALKNVRLGHERQLERAHEFKHGDGGFTSSADDDGTALLQPHQQTASQVASLALQAQKAAENSLHTAPPTTPIAAQPDPTQVVPMSTSNNQPQPVNTTTNNDSKSPLPIGPLIIFTIGILLIVFWLINNL